MGQRAYDIVYLALVGGRSSYGCYNDISIKWWSGFRDFRSVSESQFASLYSTKGSDLASFKSHNSYLMFTEVLSNSQRESRVLNYDILLKSYKCHPINT